MPLPPGAIVGGYRIVRVLGAGGMGTVYLTQDPILPRRDALKVLNADLSENAEFRARFEREANLAAALDHPNIVAVYSRGEADGQLWIAMQYVDGTDAAREIARGSAVMTPQRALRIVTEVGKAIDHAHRRGLLHRDIKPGNFLLAEVDGEEERVLLTDFGVAKPMVDGQELTETGDFLATAAYASPEQLLGHKLDHRSDIYSLGCAFYKLLTGQSPYPYASPTEIVLGHINEPPPRPSAVRPELPPALDAVIARAMAKDRGDRYSSCRELAQDAAAAFADSRAAQPDSATRRLPDKPPRLSRLRKFLLPAIFGVVIALVVGAATYFLTDHGGSGPAADRAAQIRAGHPEFADKQIAAFLVTDTDLSVFLDPSDQARFLQAIGFVYSREYRATGGEKSPRLLALSSFVLSTPVDVVLVLRADRSAGGGGLAGLPHGLVDNPNSKVAVVDDVSAVQGFRVWTDQSPDTAAGKVVPALAKALH
ncbi:serine/threonine-protein kinase [Nocardia arthritidis]|uniref:non-specific serine/threonine protein kinase n=1 Tax=Nocardia arthritidis TaxID=228602 RepID=A0A6G9YD84_9NOCA|nr:serine/threonine-protein kinase [Nocardia arthritidis]QIS11090.1 protein kinase [Nocardia arthritidis]